MSYKIYPRWYSNAACALLVVIALWAIASVLPKSTAGPTVCGHLDYINPEISCGEKPVVNKKSYAEFRKKLVEFIDLQRAAGNITHASVYFRDLHYGPTLGINEYESYSPASLLKLPLAITYVDLMASVPELEELKITYDPALHPKVLNQTITPSRTLEAGKQYTVRELLKYMVSYSDNAAYGALLDYLALLSPGKDLLKDTYTDLGIIDPATSLDETISVKSYASMILQLYQSSYLKTPEQSNYLLDLMRQSDYAGGIRQGLPENMVLAHKFGERSSVDADLKQLHDCGVIYYPHNPYLLCVMTQGYSGDALSGVIGQISKMFYEEFNSRKY